ncbi:MAG: DUF72 domain-containing protein [Nitrososphaerales archaeon]
MGDLKIGTSGWVYDFWMGEFYPTFSKPNDYLKIYSKIFYLVEIDSSFYRFPSRKSTGLWADETPDNFIFTAKIPRRITNEKRLTDYKRDLEYLYEVFQPLQKKLAAFLIQLPPSFTFTEGMGKLSLFLHDLDNSYRYSIEFRHDSWFRSETYDLLNANHVSLAWSEVPFVTNPGILTSDFIYLRFIGERDLPESSLGEIRRDLQDKKQLWARRLLKHLQGVKSAYVFFNNRFEGFAPGSVNSFRNILGIGSIDFKTLNLGTQQTLFDF